MWRLLVEMNKEGERKRGVAVKVFGDQPAPVPVDGYAVSQAC